MLCKSCTVEISPGSHMRASCAIQIPPGSHVRTSCVIQTPRGKYDFDRAYHVQARSGKTPRTPVMHRPLFFFWSNPRLNQHMEALSLYL